MRRSKRKNEIYNAAVKLFREKGFAAASMRDLADRVGLEVSSLYSHINSKYEILSDICMECSDMFEEGMSAVISDHGSHMEKVMKLVRLHMDMALHHPSSVTVFNDEWKHLPEDRLKVFLDSRRTYEANFRQLIKEGMTAGDFTKRSSKVVFNIIINSTKWLHYYPRKLSEAELDKFENDIFSFVRAGLKG